MVLSEAPNSICILRLSAIGDVCHAVSAVQAIQRSYPQAQITWVIGKVEHRLLEHLPGVRFVIFDKSQGIKAFTALRREFKGSRFDVLLHMQVALRANIAAAMIPAKVKVGFDKSRSKEGHSLFISQSIPAQSEPHVLEGFAAFARAIGAECNAPNWQMPYTNEDDDWAKEIVGLHQPVFTIAPAASKAERNWLAERYAAVADHANKAGYKVILTGGPTDMERELGEAIAKHTRCELLDLIGKTSLKQLLCVLKHSELVLAPDTGPAHMAVTVDTPVIGLYAHSNPKRTGPYLYQDNVIEVYNQSVQSQYGNPATDLPWGTRVKGADLMTLISVDQVTAVFDRVSSELRSSQVKEVDND